MKYKVTVNIEIDEIKAEMEYWKYNLKQTADNAQPAVQDYTKFIDLQENYEDFMKKYIADSLEILKDFPGHRISDIELARMNGRKHDKSWLVRIYNTI